MPFTVSHCAAIIPFAGRRLPLSALAIGAMSPDFEYMLRLKAITSVSHTWPGLITFCLPVGLVALWLFHTVTRPFLRELCPRTIRERIARESFPFAPAGRLLVLSGCIVFGAATHVVWDAFTHPTGWGVLHFPALQQIIPIETPFGSPHVYRLLQHGSTAFGLLALIVTGALWHRRTPASDKVQDSRMNADSLKRFVLLLLIAPPLLAIVLTAIRFDVPHDFDALRRFLVLAAISAMDFFVVLAIGCALYFQSLEKHRA